MRFDLSTITTYLGTADYAALALVALWGAFCMVMLVRRIRRFRFVTEQQQEEFLLRVEDLITRGDFTAAVDMCSEDSRALPQLVRLALLNRRLGLSRLRTLLVERFQRDVLADLEYRLSWIYTVIKSAPMLGLFGTVLGMMGAFAKLSGGEKVDPTKLADDISLALVTTAIGLAIAIPLVLCAASASIQIRKLEDFVSSGLNRLLDVLKSAGVRTESAATPPPAPAPAGRTAAERTFRTE
ncbi:MotA/TolQ/ExbB proton channel family protein [Thermogutta terrifontis]|jgi:biopolymer transport protein ExbB|uniref:MotA/TolQ/ExbB proton channel family protein n=1 Tax=Thermogutta terrifontis TaxID=1331910 RepID=A0A286RD58_9BACT|nr:MotA/TolQ/ExbB proton channel family protein [Thermogutta terrifontis]ASV73886.1 MotA/TolQ/ExbB proton channel family protein [Thermogutta terrifontis]